MYIVYIVRGRYAFSLAAQVFIDVLFRTRTFQICMRK